MAGLEITQYAPNANGARYLSFDAGDGISVLVQPVSERDNARAAELAAELTDVAQARAAMEFALQASKNEAADLRMQLDKVRAQVRDLETINTAAISGRRRFFGPVLMRPETPRDWTGRVWLMDPEKRESGHCLTFASVAEVRAMHPELWVVDVDTDGVLLDAWGKEG